jgi:sugar (pentulose or hexulose) kinase
MYLGIDFGTSGCRASVIDANADCIAEAAVALPAPVRDGQRVSQSPQIWLTGLQQLLDQLSRHSQLAAIERIAVDGTSGSVLLSRPGGDPLGDALMYNDASSEQALTTLKSICPEPDHLCLNLGSGLVKALQLTHQLASNACQVLSQADFITAYLSGRRGHSDYHNALKLGYDPQAERWPDWVEAQFASDSLPEVHEPGSVIGRISPSIARQTGLSADCQICVGSTDANAAFIAAGARQPGDAVTSLGSTLVLKLLSIRPVNDLQSGVYSHRLGDYWLAGGASNAGAAILRDYFSDEQIAALSRHIETHQPSPLRYYPLRSAGERFPQYDPRKQPVVTPRPASDVDFLHALLEGLARIEQKGYEKLRQLGAATLNSVKTAGGGANNKQWAAIRERLLGVPVSPAPNTQASYGAALLALHGLADFKTKKKPPLTRRPQHT